MRIWFRRRHVSVMPRDRPRGSKGETKKKKNGRGVSVVFSSSSVVANAHRSIACPLPVRFLPLSLSDTFLSLPLSRSLTLSALRIIPSLSWHRARLARTLARRTENDDDDDEALSSLAPLERSAEADALADNDDDNRFFFLASSSATAASRILIAEARSPACRASASMELEVGAIATRLYVSAWGKRRAKKKKQQQKTAA